MTLLVEAMVGALAGVVAILLWRQLGRFERLAASISLVAAAALYPGIGLAGGQVLSEMTFATAAVVGFGALALLGARVSPWFLALGWLAHGPWDLAGHGLEDLSYMPAWYPGACFGFDLVAGCYLAVRARVGWSSAGASELARG